MGCCVAFKENMTLEEYLAELGQKPNTTVSMGRKKKRGRKRAKSFPPPLVPSATVAKTIPMPAFGKARPRVTQNGTYMPREYRQQVEHLRWALALPAGLVHVSVTAVRQVPARGAKRR